MKKISRRPNDEFLKDENSFLKMKMMLEHGGQFGGMKNVDPLIENFFLKNVMNFHDSLRTCKQTTVFEKLGCPEFPPSRTIPDSMIKSAWKTLNECMSKHGIHLGAAGSVKPRQLYECAIEKVFPLQIDDHNIPGMMTCFIYEEFVD